MWLSTAHLNNKQKTVRVDKPNGHVTPGITSDTQENESHGITKAMTGIENVGMRVKSADTREWFASFTLEEKSYWATRTHNME